MINCVFNDVQGFTLRGAAPWSIARDTEHMPLPNIDPKRTGKVEIKYLEFDPSNPRLVEDGVKNPTDAQVIVALADTADLIEVVQSIAANGYIDIEPLIAQRVGEKWRVLEGNRRLAAIRILLDPSLGEEAGIKVPPISEENLATLTSVTVYAVSSADEAREYIGFKHINGPHKWDAIAKARFAADWYKKDKEKGVTIDTIARRLGDGHDTVVRLVNGMFVLDQAHDAKIYDIKDRYPGKKFAFSHLYTALTRPGYREFLGLSDEWRAADPKPNPVPEENLDNLKQVLVWLYGSKPDQTLPVITSQNPDLKLLAEVLENPSARKMMMVVGDLRKAHEQVEKKGARFETALLSAKQQTETAMGQIIGFDPQDSTLLQVGLDLRDTSDTLYTTMEAKFLKAQKSKQ